MDLKYFPKFIKTYWQHTKSVIDPILLVLGVSGWFFGSSIKISPWVGVGIVIISLIFASYRIWSYEHKKRVQFETEDGEGVVLQWREPDWFEFTGEQFAEQIGAPSRFSILVKFYLRNTTNQPATLQSLDVNFSRADVRFWGQKGDARIRREDKGDWPPPLEIESGGEVAINARFIFGVGNISMEKFISTLKNAPLLNFEVIYTTRVAGETNKEKAKQSLDFSKEYPSHYLEVLEDWYPHRVEDAKSLLEPDNS